MALSLVLVTDDFLLDEPENMDAKTQRMVSRILTPSRRGQNTEQSHDLRRVVFLMKVARLSVCLRGSCRSRTKSSKRKLENTYIKNSLDVEWFRFLLGTIDHSSSSIQLTNSRHFLYTMGIRWSATSQIETMIETNWCPYTWFSIDCYCGVNRSK